MLIVALLPFLLEASSTSAQVCDDNKCLDASCQAVVWQNKEKGVFACADGHEGRIDDSFAEESIVITTPDMQGELQKYTCCLPGYDEITVETLQTCSVEACTSPDGKGGTDCSADGFIHPMVCDQESEYRHPQKESGGTIYSPYVCCSSRSDYSNTAQLVASSIWSAIAGLAFLACSVLIVGILSSKQAREKGYNLYLVFLALPDALFNVFSLVRSIVNIQGLQISTGLGVTCHALEWFHTAANMWLNAWIVYQVHSMLLRSRSCVHTPPPTPKQVLLQVSGIYFFAGLWAAWSLVLLFQGSNLFANTNAAWLTSKSLMCGPPFMYVIIVCTHVWWRQLLPRQGRTRVLSLYFLRVVLVFLCTWVPFLILVDVTYYKTASLWMLGLAYYFASLQGVLSVVVALGKPDVKRAVANLLCCRGDDFNHDENGGFVGSQAGRIWRELSFQVRSTRSTTVTKGSITDPRASGMDESRSESQCQHPMIYEEEVTDKVANHV